MIPGEALANACNRAIAEGYTITPLCTLSGLHKRCCPIGAMGIAIGMWGASQYQIGHGIGMTTEEINAFTNGFDGANQMICRSDTEDVAFVLGMQFRERYVECQ